MELLEFLKLIKKYLIIFMIFFSVVFSVGFFLQNRENSLYNVSMAINISREGQIKTQDYQYDQLYRLQADEKFGENIVGWMGDPGLIELNKKDFIASSKVGWGDISNIKTIQVAPNYVKVEFQVKNPQSALIFRNVLIKNLNKKNQQINANQNNKDWFKLIFDKAQITKNNINIYFVLSLIICLGILAGVFGVLIMNYFSGNENRN